MMIKSAQAFIDKTAIGLSVLCMVHCLMLPVAFTILPALSTVLLEDEKFHEMMILAVLPTSLIALSMGCKKHKNVVVPALGFLGLAILSVPVIFGHDLLSESEEKVTTLFGASLIALGHIMNHNLCMRSSCRH